MRIVILTTDGRDLLKTYAEPLPNFGVAPEALLEGLATLPEAEIHVVSCLRQAVTSPIQLGANVTYHSLLVPKLGWMTTAYQGCIRAVRGKLRELQPDIIHGQGTERDCAMCAVFSGFTNVLTIHGNMAELARRFGARIGSFHWLAARLENFTLPRTAGVFCNSRYTTQLVAPRARHTWPVPNPIRLAFFAPASEPVPPPSVPILLNIGVISPRKRQVELLELAAELHARGRRFLLRFIGDLHPSDPYGIAFQTALREAEAAGYAEFVGPKKIGELVRLFDGAQALIHCPSEEAFGLVVAEALARNLKFFGSRVGGIVDIAEGVEGAELLDLERWDELGSALSRWLEAGAPRPTDAARVMRERYHPEIIARRHLEIYREVLARDS